MRQVAAISERAAYGVAAVRERGQE
jgi:hypothetical protein